MMHADRVKPYRVRGIVAIGSCVAEKHTDLIN